MTQTNSAHYINLMQEMVEDQEKSNSILAPGGYWKPHADDMINIVKKHGIESFRSSPEKALQAFATGHNYKPPLAMYRKFLTLHNCLKSLPYFSKYDRLIESGYYKAKVQASVKLKAMHALIGYMAPEFLEIEEKIIGDPILFEIKGRQYSEHFLLKLLEIAQLKQHIDLSKVSTVMEIGSSYGLFSNVLRKAYPNIERYILLDIAPVSAFTYYYLERAFPGEVASYQDFKDKEKIEVEKLGKITILCAHQLSKVEGKLDLCINTASFQEMEVQQVQTYCDFIKDHSQYFYTNNTVESEFNGLTLESYQKMLAPMTLDKAWMSPTQDGYRPSLFKA